MHVATGRRRTAQPTKAVGGAATIGVLSLALAACGGPGASPELSLSKSSGPVGTVVQVSGKAGGGCTIPATWHGFRFERPGLRSSSAVPAMTPAVNPNGTWTAMFAVPSYLGSGGSVGPVTPGRYELVAEACKGHVRATASFRVTSMRPGASAGRAVAMAVTSDGNGYWIVQADGHVSAFGDARTYGSLTGRAATGDLVVGIARTYDNHGYWLAAADGHVYRFGDAGNYGSLTPSAGDPVTGIAAAPTGHGYWLLSASGAVHGFGDARTQGQPPGRYAPYASISARPGGGYIVVAALNAATYLFPGTVHEGGGPGTALSGAVVGAASTASGNGAWEAGLDGGVVTIGDATFHGSASGTPAAAKAPVTAVAATPNGLGYWLLTADGTVSGFGDAHVLAQATG